MRPVSERDPAAASEAIPPPDVASAEGGATRAPDRDGAPPSAPAPASKKKKRRGSRGREAELLFARWLRAQGWLVHLAAPTGFKRLPDGRAVTSSHDIFGVFDVIAISTSPRAKVWLVQITTQAGRSARRRKIEAIADKLPRVAMVSVSLVSHERTPDPAHRGRSVHSWRVEDLGATGWLKPRAVQFFPRDL